METRGGSRRAWTLGLLTGAGFAAGIVLLETTVLWREAPWLLVVLTGVGAGAVFGAVLGPSIVRTEREMWRIGGEGLTWPQFRTAARASRSGRVPPDPRLREAAIRLAVYQLAQHRRRRRSTLIACAVGMAFFLVDAVFGNWVGVLGVAGLVVLTGSFLYERIRLSRAVLRLRAASAE